MGTEFVGRAKSWVWAVKRRGLLGLVLLLVGSLSAWAQRQPHVILKVAPLSWMDPDATVQGAVEVRMKPRLSIQAEFGYGADRLRRGGFGPSPWTPNTNLAGKEVWRARLEGRYYTSYSDKYPSSGTYVAVEILCKQINVTNLDTLLGGETIDPVFVYAPVTRSVYGLHTKIGTQVLLSYNPYSFWSRWVVDFYVGPGIRYANVVGRSAETDVLFSNPVLYERFRYSAYRPGDARWQFGASVGLKIGVSL